MSPARACRLLGPVVLIAAAACGEREPSDVRAGNPVPSDASAHEARETPRPDEGRPRIVVLGDSLTAGLGLQPAEAYPALAPAAARRGGHGPTRSSTRACRATRRPAGSAGSTGRSRATCACWSWRSAATTGCAGCRPTQLQRNLAAIIERAQAPRDRRDSRRDGGAAELRARLHVAFRSVYPALAKSTTWRWCRFCSKASPASTALNQRDGIHPTAEGARRVADNVWPVLRPIAARLPAAVEDGARLRQ